LFAVLVSGRSPTTVAEFVIVPTVVAVVTIVIVTTCWLFIVPIVHCTRLPPVHVPCVELTETKVRPAGSESATLTFVSVTGPLFFTDSVQVTVPFVCSDVGLAVLTIWRSTVGVGVGVAGGVDGGGLTLTTALACAVTSGPDGGWPVTVATFV